MSDEAPLKFEEAVEQVEAIIERIESGEFGLEESIERSQQGVKLIKHCRGILDRAEKRIAELLADEADGDGLVVAEDDEEDDEEADEDGGGA